MQEQEQTKSGKKGKKGRKAVKFAGNVMQKRKEELKALIPVLEKELADAKEELEQIQLSEAPKVPSKKPSTTGRRKVG